MGYIFVIVAVIVVVPLLFVLARSRPSATPAKTSTIKPVIRDQPTGGEPSLSRVSAVKKVADSAARRLPPS